MGHNMGANHDWFVDASVTPRTYAHGYVYTPGQWRTIMSYNDRCAAQGFNCTRLLAWASPTRTYNGIPMGIAAGTSTACSAHNTANPPCDADDARLLNETAFTVANFRQGAPVPLSVVSLAPSVSTTMANNAVTWTAQATGGTAPYTYKFWLFDGSTWSISRDWSSSNTWAWTPTAPGTYTVQVWARNAGSSATYDAWLGSGSFVVSTPSVSVGALTSSVPTATAANTVVWTTQATGGSSPYTYKFWVFDGSTWSVGRDWNASNVWAWTPALAGTYMVQVWVRNSGSSAAYDAWLNSPPFLVSPRPLTVLQLSPNPALTNAGTPVQWTASVTGGTAPYTYQFWVFDGTRWISSGWTSTATWTWVPALPGTYNVQVWVRNAGSTTTLDTYGLASYAVGKSPELRATALTADRTSPTPYYTPVTWTATASGGTGPYTYKFWVWDGASWTIGQDWSASPTFVWIPTVPGTYQFQVWVRNAGSTAAWDAWQGAGPYTAGSWVPLNVTGLTADRTFPSPAGTPVTWTASALGGNGPYSYKFYVFNGSSWVVGQDWSISNTWTWVPPSMGTYSFQVWVRNAGSANTNDAFGPAGPVSIGNSVPLSIATFDASPLAPFVANATARLRAVATGGTGPYTYQFWAFDGTSWSIIKPWSEANVAEWKPSGAGSYSLQVWVRNVGSGTPYDAWQGLTNVTVLAESAIPGVAGTWDITCNRSAYTLANFPSFPSTFVATLSQSASALTGTLAGGANTRTLSGGSVSNFFNVSFGEETLSNVWAQNDGDFYFSMALDSANPNRMVGSGGTYCSSATALKR
jgi:hypothetical protein